MAYGGEHVDSVSREDLDGGDSTEVAPVVAIGSPRHGGVVVAKVFSGE